MKQVSIRCQFGDHFDCPAEVRFSDDSVEPCSCDCHKPDMPIDDYEASFLPPGERPRHP